ncbi:PIN domain-like protein [Russula aff. rugulosa BPL654]|nr:PIN domain-like protein [Russula aff. rugulosa BPL654]
MGVLGLTPFLHKTCPQVITQLPNRLKSLSNKTLVIDGTLITQRFHFAPMPHQYRHILGWFRLVNELREHGIRAICVFDGEERSAAKSSEQNRRRHIRRTEALRGEIESDRLSRLLALTKGLDALRLFDKDERQLFMTSFRNQMAGLEDHLIPKHDPNQLSFTDLSLQRRFADVEPSLDQRENYWLDEVDVDELYQENGTCVAANLIAPEEVDETFDHQYGAEAEEPDFHHFGQLLSYPNMVNQYEDRHVLVTTPEMDLPEDHSEGKKWQGLASSLAELYMHYRRGVATLDVIPTTVISATPTAFASQEFVEPANAQVQLDVLSSAFPLIHPSPLSSSSPVDPADVQVQAAMSKTQYQLTLEEGKLWEKLTDPDEAIDYDESPTVSILASLREKSSFMVQSYHRRNNPPTEITYERAKSTGPYEAEALASSLVLNGCADYVASEDTDVLVYGAPLLRNITNRDKALLLIPGSEVRSALRLDARALIDFALLLGTDFAPRIRNIGPHRALQYIHKYGTIENLLAEERQYVPRVPLQTYLQAIRDAREVFVKLPPLPDPHMLEQKEYREGEVAAILGSHRLQRFLDPDTRLDVLHGNYFNDNPAVAI